MRKYVGLIDLHGNAYYCEEYKNTNEYYVINGKWTIDIDTAHNDKHWIIVIDDMDCMPFDEACAQIERKARQTSTEKEYLEYCFNARIKRFSIQNHYSLFAVCRIYEDMKLKYDQISPLTVTQFVLYKLKNKASALNDYEAEIISTLRNDKEFCEYFDKVPSNINEYQIAEACKKHSITYDSSKANWVNLLYAFLSNDTIQKEETPMSYTYTKPGFNVRNFLGDTDLSKVSDDELVENIIELTKQRDKIVETGIKSKKLETSIKNIENDIKSLTELLDKE